MPTHGVAYSAIAFGQDGKVVKLSAPLDYPLQTVVAGELMGWVQAARCSSPGTKNFVDCEAVIKGAKRGEA